MATAKESIDRTRVLIADLNRRFPYHQSPEYRQQEDMVLQQIVDHAKDLRNASQILLEIVQLDFSPNSK